MRLSVCQCLCIIMNCCCCFLAETSLKVELFLLESKTRRILGLLGCCCWSCCCCVSIMQEQQQVEWNGLWAREGGWEKGREETIAYALCIRKRGERRKGDASRLGWLWISADVQLARSMVNSNSYNNNIKKKRPGECAEHPTFNRLKRLLSFNCSLRSVSMQSWMWGNTIEWLTSECRMNITWRGVACACARV